MEQQQGLSEDEERKLVGELIDFLSDEKIEVRKIAIQHIKTYSASPRGRVVLRSFPTLQTKLIKLINDRETIAHEAYTCLINLTQEEVFSRGLVQKGIVTRIAEAILDKENKFVGLASMLLSNLTHNEEGSKALLMLERPVLKGYHAAKLIDYFVESSFNVYNNINAESAASEANKKEEEEDKSAWIANVILNLSQLKEGRELLISKDNNYLKPFLSLLSSPSLNIIRRRALVGTLRNILFEDCKEEIVMDFELIEHLTSLLVHPSSKFSSEDEHGMNEALLKAIREKKRFEDDEACRKILIESLFLLSSVKSIRSQMRALNIYPVLRELHKEEKSEAVANAITDVVELLIRDEETEESQLAVSTS
eukprot:TRINITY_DN11602_c0_g1_i1.p1 TRINITY_DN11602_c0_g1~~TRINITY_DN11602_c0_g1_i1.p1  ORF type:complete len:382 (-),score=105.48 TRINITY_DN11602_c0_g1_i1:38-1135(-)